MCTGRCQFRKPGTVERNQRAENIGGQAPVIFRTSVSPYAQQRPTWHHGHQTAEMEGGFSFESAGAVVEFSALAIGPSGAWRTMGCWRARVPGVPVPLRWFFRRRASRRGTLRSRSTSYSCAAYASSGARRRAVRTVRSRDDDDQRSAAGADRAQSRPPRSGLGRGC